MQHSFRFGIDSGPNARAKNGVTFNGSIAQFFPYPDANHCKVGIHGPAGAERGSAIIDKATARKLGAALLGWAMS